MGQDRRPTSLLIQGREYTTSGVPAACAKSSQMAIAAGGSFIVALLPQDSAFGPISVFAGFVVLALAFGLFAVRLSRARRYR